MKTILTALPLLAFYLALVCGRRLGPTDTTLFVANATMHMILFAFMLRAIFKWRRSRSWGRLAVAMASVVVMGAVAYHPSTSPRTFYGTGMDNAGSRYTVGANAIDARPSVTGTLEEQKAIEDQINGRRSLQQPPAVLLDQSTLTDTRIETLPVIR